MNERKKIIIGIILILMFLSVALSGCTEKSYKTITDRIDIVEKDSWSGYDVTFENGMRINTDDEHIVHLELHRLIRIKFEYRSGWYITEYEYLE